MGRPLVAVVLALALSPVMAAAPAPRPARAESTEQLAREYRRLRAKKVQPGVLDRETQAFGGRKHEVMGELVARLGVRGTKRARIVALMGEPDSVVDHPSPRDCELLRNAGGGPGCGDATLLLVYEWRGMHDYAWFGIGDGAVVSSGWYFALE